MQFRPFGKLDWKASVLGFGAMRLPTTSAGDIDEPKAIAMMRYAIDRGVNYVDTAYPYHQGKSEIVVGKALQDGYRDKVKLATKSPIWEIKKADDFDTLLAEQLTRLQTDHVDFYLLHGLGKDRWKTVLDFDLLRRAEAALKDGRIRYLGFSFHDGLDAFKTIVDGYDDWTFCQIQYNYMDTQNQAGTEGLRYAAAKGLAVVVMEPVRGGRLAKAPQAIQAMWDSSPVKRTPSDWALQWVWNQPEVAVVLSGMSNMQQVEENLRSAEESAVHSLSAEELELINRARNVYQDRTVIPCTKCNYCMPCPNGVNIPGNFELYNDGRIYESVDMARSAYARFFAEPTRASACIQCRTCEDKCPQKIVISEWMPEVHAVLGEGKSY
jgi:uncharacterized protein